MRYTNQQKLEAVEREIRQRRWVYSGLIARGRMKESEATYQIAIMEAIAEDYRRDASAERLL